MVNSNLQVEQIDIIQESKPKKKAWLWWCSGCIILVCITLGIVAFFLFSLSKESYPLEGKVSFPSSVKKGDNFYFVITLTNKTTEPIFIKHIVLHSELAAPYLLDGSTVISVEPDMESDFLLNGKDTEYSYFREIKPRETQTVIFTMRAENIGTYYANLGVYAKDPLHSDPAFIDAFHFTNAKVEITP